VSCPLKTVYQVREYDRQRQRKGSGFPGTQCWARERGQEVGPASVQEVACDGKSRRQGLTPRALSALPCWEGQEHTKLPRALEADETLLLCATAVPSGSPITILITHGPPTRTQLPMVPNLEVSLTLHPTHQQVLLALSSNYIQNLTISQPSAHPGQGHPLLFGPLQ
jgi:hypothetical protein